MEFYPELIRSEKVFIAKTPLFIIKNGNKKTFAYSHEEMNKLRKSVPKSATISYLKGLGELNPKILADCILTEKRELIPITMEDEESTIQKLEEYMGIDATVRRELAKGEL